MVSGQEFRARISDFLSFNRYEITGLAVAVLITAFIFSFRDWGEETFDLLIGFQHLLVAGLIAMISFVVRICLQKLYALFNGYEAKFKVFWGGLLTTLVIGFISLGWIPLILIGTMSVSVRIRQKLGEYRYGFSYWNNAMIGFWGVLGNLLLALFFALGAYYSPQSYFFTTGLMFNLIMAFCSLIPLPQLDGLAILFGSKSLYGATIGATFLAAVLLLTKTQMGLIIAIILAAIYLIIYVLITSWK